MPASAYVLTRMESGIRLLTESIDDIKAYRAIRQKILDIGDGRFFSDSYTREAALYEYQWPQWCSETPAHCIFGNFDTGKLIGILMATQYGAPEDKIVEFETVWTEPAYRKQGSMRLLHRRAEKWAWDNGYKRVVLFVRADNEAAQAMYCTMGARYIGVAKYAETWADGSIEDTLRFELDLAARWSISVNSTHVTTGDHYAARHVFKPRNAQPAFEALEAIMKEDSNAVSEQNVKNGSHRRSSIS